jgi:hypothetical protein
MGWTHYLLDSRVCERGGTPVCGSCPHPVSIGRFPFFLRRVVARADTWIGPHRLCKTTTPIVRLNFPFSDASIAVVTFHRVLGLCVSVSWVICRL